MCVYDVNVMSNYSAYFESCRDPKLGIFTKMENNKHTFFLEAVTRSFIFPLDRA